MRKIKLQLQLAANYCTKVASARANGQASYCGTVFVFCRLSINKYPSVIPPSTATIISTWRQALSIPTSARADKRASYRGTVFALPLYPACRLSINKYPRPSWFHLQPCHDILWLTSRTKRPCQSLHLLTFCQFVGTYINTARCWLISQSLIFGSMKQSCLNISTFRRG